MSKERLVGNRNKLTVSGTELAVLLYHVHKGVENPSEVGFEDADRTLSELLSGLEKGQRRPLSIDLLESALWSCNLMAEKGKFWSPDNRSFDGFVNKMLSNELEYDKFYHLIKLKKQTSKQNGQA